MFLAQAGAGSLLPTRRTQAAADRTPADGELAKTAYKVHMQAGTVLEVLVPLHIGAVGFHLARGHNLLKRFAK